MPLVEAALWFCVLVGLALALGFALGQRAGGRRSRSSEVVARSVKVRRGRIDARPLPRFVEPGDDLEITVIASEPTDQELLELSELDLLEELRPSRVDLSYEDEAAVDEPTAPAARILMVACGDSDQGRTRERNEDRLLVLPERSVFVVADGMGGYAGGEVASELAVRTLNQAYERRDFQGRLDVGQPLPRRARELALAVQMANHAVYEAASTTPALSHMGTTLLAARFSPRKQRVYIAHVGDSRCYRVREGRIRQLTTDHNLASVGVRGPHQGRLIRAVGLEPSVTMDLLVDRPRPGDLYCLCSDGLPKMVGDQEILRVVCENADLEAAVYSLIELANDRGGRDNVTVVLVQVVEAYSMPVKVA